MVPNCRRVDRDRAVGDQLRTESHVRHARRIACVLPDGPQSLVADIDIGCDLLEQLFAWNLISIVSLQLEKQPFLPRRGTCQKALIFFRIEPTFGLKLGILRELRRRRISSCFGNLLVADLDAPAAILLAQQCVVDQLLEGLISETPPLVERNASSGLLGCLLLEQIDRVVPGGSENFLAIHRGYCRRRRNLANAEEARSLGQQKSADEENY